MNDEVSKIYILSTLKYFKSANIGLKSNQNRHMDGWKMSSVQFWGEQPRGAWILSIKERQKLTRRYFYEYTAGEEVLI